MTKQKNHSLTALDWLTFHVKKTDESNFRETLIKNNYPSTIKFGQITLKRIYLREKNGEDSEFQLYEFLYDVIINKDPYAFLGIQKKCGKASEENIYKVKIHNEVFYNHQTILCELYYNFTETLGFSYVNVSRVDIALFHTMSIGDWFNKNAEIKGYRIKLFNKVIEEISILGKYMCERPGERCNPENKKSYNFVNTTRNHKKSGPANKLKSYFKSEFQHDYQKEYVEAHGLDSSNYYNNEITIFHNNLKTYSSGKTKEYIQDIPDLFDPNFQLALYVHFLNKLMEVRNQHGMYIRFIDTKVKLVPMIKTYISKKDPYFHEKNSINDCLKNYLKTKRNILLDTASKLADNEELKLHLIKACNKLKKNIPPSDSIINELNTVANAKQEEPTKNQFAIYNTHIKKLEEERLELYRQITQQHYISHPC